LSNPVELTMQSWETNLLVEFEKLGEEEVRLRLQKGQYGAIGSERYLFTEAWLRAKRDTRGQQRADRTLSNARRADIIAVIAMILSAATAISVAIMRRFSHTSLAPFPKGERNGERACRRIQ